MSLSTSSSTRIVTYRSNLKSEISDFLDDLGLKCAHTADAVVEIVVALSKYEEEGRELFPDVYLCVDRKLMDQVLGSSDFIELGRGPLCDDTAKLALKRCAPLCGPTWSIYLEKGATDIAYGMFAMPATPFALEPAELLIDSPLEENPTVLVRHLAKNLVGLSANNGRSAHFHFSARRADAPVDGDSIWTFVKAAVASVPDDVRADTERILLKSLRRSLRFCHGTMLAVVPSGQKPSGDLFDDAVSLSPALDFPARVRAFKEAQGPDQAASLMAACQLLDGMINSDGLVLFSSGGIVLRYRVLGPV